MAGVASGATARADEFHYNNILIGDRAAGMGGAYTAVSDDPSGLYYNPAGVTYAGGRNLSASVNAYHQTNTDYKNVLGGHGWHRRSSAILPNFFGVTQPLGEGVVGFSYAVPDSITEDQDQIFYGLPSSIPGVSINRYVVNFNHRDNTYQLGPSYAYSLSKRFSLGATLYGHYRERESALNQLINLSDGRYEWTNTYYETHEYGVKPILGAMWSPHDKVAVGASMSKVFVIDSETKSQQTFKGINYNGNTVDLLLFESDEKREHPFTTNLGIAVFPSDAFLVAWDFSYYTATSDDIEGDKEATWNTALGAEYYLSERWALRGGVYTNHANTPDVVAGKVNQPEHIDVYGGTLSISHFAGNSSTTLGMGYGFGSGEAQLFAGSPNIQEVDLSTFMLFISAAYSY